MDNEKTLGWTGGFSRKKWHFFRLKPPVQHCSTYIQLTAAAVLIHDGSNKIVVQGR
jgi:hypothetical protein